MKRGLLLLLALACAAFVAAGTARSESAAIRGCGYVTGPAYTINGKTGTRYAVMVTGSATCALARTWTPRLANKRPTGSTALKTISGGPVGWRCFAVPLPFPTTKAVAGGCTRRTGVAFTWGPKTV